MSERVKIPAELHDVDRFDQSFEAPFYVAHDSRGNVIYMDLPGQRLSVPRGALFTSEAMRKLRKQGWGRVCVYINLALAMNAVEDGRASWLLSASAALICAVVWFIHARGDGYPA